VRNDLAQKYARAIYEAALESWLRPLSAFKEKLTGDPNLQAQITDITQPFAVRQQLVQSLFPDAASEVRNFVLILVRDGHLGLLDDIVAEFQTLLRRGPEAKVVEVSSAVALSGEERRALEARLEKRFGSGLEFRYQVDPKLLGGVRIQVGDQIIDGSVAGQLAALRRELTRE